MSEPGQLFLEDAIDQFRKYKRMAERAVAQIDDDAFFHTPDPRSNSIAVIMKHLAGNMRSRWTDFLTTDGESPDRNRDSEFVIDDGVMRPDVIHWWENGWKLVFDALEGLSEDDLMRTVTIRGEDHLVSKAIARQLTHYAYHVGQIVQLARSRAGSEWNSLSIPRGESEQFNAANWGTADSS
jgi:Protein of unknown function (DUF1572)